MNQGMGLAVERREESGGASPRLAVRESGIYGMGCFALAHLPARKKIAFYAGEIVRGSRRIEARLRAQEAIKVIRLRDDLAIDGAVGGNETASINHSCDPNAYMRVVPGDRVAFFALKDIRPGEEITINYRDPDHPQVCRCGADKCRSNTRPGRSIKSE
ncbi:MAG: SET domain-containing protein-lysine N-methyltransferase [Acidobacteria bacterium]|nr:SET domain-containing protein-lysine N-methyltransferase [Acidobacteriota bacterium]